uniref:Nucleic acid binding n=1 Tax=Zea mays TaxID=4577 RepID=A0A804LLW6_MAIZE
MCGDQDFPAAASGGGHGPPDHAATDNILALFLTGHHSEAQDCKPPFPAAAAHFMDEAAASQQQQQQLMYQLQQQQIATMEGCTTMSAPVARSTVRPLALMEIAVRGGEAPPRSDQLSSLDRGRRDAEGEDVGGGHGAYDERFGQYGCDFTFYDYNRPEELPVAMKHAYRVIVADPPYLSKECLEKVAKTVSFLARPEGSFLLLLTGEVQMDRALELLNVRPCGFRPRHSNKLGNEFRLFAN